MLFHIFAVSVTTVVLLCFMVRLLYGSSMNFSAKKDL